MSGRRYVPEGIYLVCDKGTKMSTLRSFSHKEVSLFSRNMCTKVDKTVMVNFDPFGACACMNGNTCTAPVTDWTNLSTGITLGENEFLLEDSTLPCSLGGTIRIFYSKQDAMGAVHKPKKKWWQKAVEYVETYEEFKTGVGEGIWKGLKGTVVGAWDLTKWASKHTTIYQLANPKGYAEQIQKDKELFTAMGSAAKKAGVWAYRSSGYNMILNNDDWKAQTMQNRVMMSKLAEKAGDMNARQWGNVAGQIVFEVGMEIGTAGAAGVVTALKVADKAKDTAVILENAQDVAKAMENAEDIIGETKHLDMPEQLGDMTYEPKRFDPDDATNKQKGNYGEMQSTDNMVNNQALKDKGYDLKRIGEDAPTGLDDKIKKGIDGIYENNTPPPKFVIDEAKFNTAQLGKTKDGKQMSDGWITGEKTGNNRVVDQLDEIKADEIMDALEDGQVEKVLSKVDKNGNVTTKKLDKDGNIIGDWP